MDADSRTITVANLSATIDDAQLQRAVAAIDEQIVTDFQPEWGGDSRVIGVTGPKEALPTLDPMTDAVIYLGEKADDRPKSVEDVLAYHTAVQGQVPYGFVYLDVVDANGGDWCVTLSHEVLELLGDPTATCTLPGPRPEGLPVDVTYDFELCDPVQSDSYAKSNGQNVSNFVCRAYFQLPGGSGQTNFLGRPLEPFGVRPKSYLQYEIFGAGVQIKGARAAQRLLRRKRRLMFGQTRVARRARGREAPAPQGINARTATSRSR